MTLVFTLCSNNYLAQAITLGQSLIANNPKYDFKIGLVDRRDKSIDYNNIPFEIKEVESIGITDWENMILRYNIQELNTAVKPFFFNYFINREDSYKQIIYLDPDILVYGPFSELEKELEENDIILTPHITNPINDDKVPAENGFLNTGLYNLGFLAIKTSSNARQMINWWEKRLETRGYNDVKNGMFTDQLWINFVPIFFRKVESFINPGYNMAYWNLHERVITKNEVNSIYVNGDNPLIFFHFSGFSLSKPDEISKYQNRYSFTERSDILPLFVEYGKLLGQNGYNFYKDCFCTYSGIKEEYDHQRVINRIKQIPIFKRAMRKVINYIIKKFDIILDYHNFYER